MTNDAQNQAYDTQIWNKQHDNLPSFSGFEWPSIHGRILETLDTIPGAVNKFIIKLNHINITNTRLVRINANPRFLNHLLKEVVRRLHGWNVNHVSLNCTSYTLMAVSPSNMADSQQDSLHPVQRQKHWINIPCFRKKTSTHIIGYKLRNSCLILIIFDIKIPHIIWHRTTA